LLQIKKRLLKLKRQTTDEIGFVLESIGKNAPHQKTGIWNLKDRTEQRARWATWAKTASATDMETGESISMSEVIEITRTHRFNEVYAFLKGIEKSAVHAGLDWCFTVLTAPPRFHPNPQFGSSKWDGSLPVDSHKFIAATWKQATDELRLKHDIYLAGFRSPEAHQDGCTHLNVVFFCAPSELKTVQDVIRKHFDWHESAVEFRTNDGRAKFASYAMKYAIKSLHAEDTSADDAWYSTWGIRRYQFFGVPSLSTWRTLRSIKNAPDNWTAQEESIWRAARRGDAAEFIDLNGGLNVKQKNRPLSATTKSENETKTKTVTSNSEVIFADSKPVWRITRSPLIPFENGILKVILKLSEENEDRTKTQKSTPLKSDLDCRNEVCRC
jgi:hypothetical protein